MKDGGPTVRLEPSLSQPREVAWGQPWQHGTAAYWVRVAEQSAMAPSGHRLGDSLEEEIAACILGGYGLPYEVGLAAYEVVRRNVLASSTRPPADLLEQLLSAPLRVGGRSVRYRFPRQRARRLAGALDFLAEHDRPTSPREIRDWLVLAPGIGMKTASWIVRNHWASDEIAVLDVHVIRAGIAAGIFPKEADPRTGYRELEELFILWANTGDVSAATLDAVIWSEQAYWSRVQKGL
ncbi:hypothetical protein N136_00375 [Leifsonia aquatica ATCC 14665]|uniref:HhH-GPD domain-containing protein n=3 Tax=Leifsonia aquatica TaxID=144185 RepID=U2RXJ4_LEIAQ|nr:hypothetical protein N136_00375 [Leifsonia aquatica ATCC 14665]